MFREKDIRLLKEKGIDIKTAEQQIKSLRSGFPFMRLTRAAGVGKGIIKVGEEQKKYYTQLYDEADHLERVKFVPASGAASRMFKALFEFDELFKQNNYNAKILLNEAYKHVKECFDRITDFAFYPLLEKKVSKHGTSINEAIKKGNYHIILASLLGEEGLNYGTLPKGLIVFHRYGNQLRTAFEEHMVEGGGYAKNKKSEVHIHLTVSPEHRKGFENLLSNVRKMYEENYGVHYIVNFSVQKSSTDTLAIDGNGEPFRETGGNLTFRPGGHGALLENLNDITGDLVFIKNIDNVSYEEKNVHTYIYKKILGGMLIHFQKRIYNYISLLEKQKEINDGLIKEIRKFLADDLGTNIPSKALNNSSTTAKTLIDFLNRPLRVCGMVVNSGEPGGGPFWVKGKNGLESLQIVESSQIDHHDPEQEAIMNSASHFNPVDMVCGLKDYRGRRFDLLKYRDPDTGFISKKFKYGKPLKALELPGLWNGAMADWNTVFAEMPVLTFSPVKTMHDLLRPEHQKTS